MKVVITRSNWLRGKGSRDSFLFRYSDGKMCCLGFLGIACGISKRDLLGRTTPEDVKVDPLIWPSGTLEPVLLKLSFRSGFTNGPIIREIVRHNDDPDVNEHTREEYLRNDFKGLGVEIEFED